MRRVNWLGVTMLLFFFSLGFVALGAGSGRAAYYHMGEIDSPNFAAVYPDRVGTKLDSCNLCHSGGAMSVGGKTTNVGSCQWCHYSFGYDSSGNILDTLNGYGMAYLAHGRSKAAVRAIDGLDSDGDGYTNAEEIAAVRYPGDAKDDPTKVSAAYKVLSLEKLDAMPQHSQFLLMNAHKSTDSYAEYSGVPLEELLKGMVLPSAAGITVYSPDGFSQYHPLKAEAGFYQIFGKYPRASYYYSDESDVAKYPKEGWCDYSSPNAAGRKSGDPIQNPAGLKMLLATRKDGKLLDSGVLDQQNRLNGEGPFRIVPPQLEPGPPDQRSTAKNQSVAWAFDPKADHNAGYSTRSATIIRVDPLPPGTTDIDLLEAGWGYIDQGKILIYGAIDPAPVVEEKLDSLIASLQRMDGSAFVHEAARGLLIDELAAVKDRVRRGSHGEAVQKLESDILEGLRGCGPLPPKGQFHWLARCDDRKSLFWSANEILVLLKTTL